VACIPLDDALADEAPTFIKIDVEGAEAITLHGGLATIRRRPAYSGHRRLPSAGRSMAIATADSRLVPRLPALLAPARRRRASS